jgi:hypothetical protein
MAFPPCRSTDADTAGDDTLEARIGLLRLEVNDSHSTRKTPLSRINYGIGPHFEAISELEYAMTTANSTRVLSDSSGQDWRTIAALALKPWFFCR